MKINNSLRLSTSTSIQAITAHARRAAAISAVDRKLEKKRQDEQRKQAKKHRALKQTPIELSTRSITASVRAFASDGISLVNETPGRYSSAYAIICLYRDADIEAHRLAKERHKTDPTVKVPRLCPLVRYVLYPSIIDNTYLGSVAIYCDNPRARQASIAEAGHLFGITVKAVNLEAGLSEYVDVVLKA